MIRKRYTLPLTILAVQVCSILLFGTSRTGTLVTNCAQILASSLAVVACVRARTRGHGMARPFWSLMACGMAGWAVANAGWMYYESLLLAPVPSFSVVRLLFTFHPVFYAFALFLDQEKDSPEFHWETLLDCIQVSLVFFSVFFGLFYIQQLQGSPTKDADLVLLRVFGTVNIAMAALAAVQMMTSRTRRMRSLYAGATLFLLTYMIGGNVADYIQTVLHVPTGTWLDLGWTMPFLVAAVWANGWVEQLEPQSVRAAPAKTIGRLALKNVALVLPPLTVLILVSQFGPGWRRIGFVLLAVSIVCYAVRLGMSQYREAFSAEAARRRDVAMESALDGMCVLNSEGVHVYTNPAFAHIMGFQGTGEVLGKTWREIYNPSDSEKYAEQIRESLRKDGKWSGQISLHRRAGGALPVEMSFTVIPGGDTVCVARDISERLNAERARTQAEVQYRQLIEQVAAISYIAELGIDGQWLYVSPQVGSMLGYTSDEWLSGSRDWVRHVHPEDQPKVVAAEEASLKGLPYQAEYRLTRKDGRIIWVSDTAVVVPGADSRPLMEGIIVDITERKQLETQLQQSRRMEAVGRLAGGIAHDFNNLLTIIKGYAELAFNRTNMQPDLRADIERIADASERATTLVRQLLAFSRKQVMQPKVLSLNDIVLGLDNLLRRLMSENIEMRTIVGKEMGTVKADPAQIEQVIMNLVVNARDAMPDGGRLIIETSNADLDEAYARDHVTVKPGHYVMLAVSDTGVGMDADTIAHIFEPFYTTKGSGQGTGLGLSTVYGIVKQSGGYIWVYSELGRGSCFKVYLPRLADPAEAAKKSKSDAPVRRGTETILLVEDEPAVRELTRLVLTKQGYSVLEANSPEDAERKCENREQPIHMLLTDVIMPGVSGHELAKRITARHPKIRVLYMSGYTHNMIASGGMLERGISFLQKPFTPAALMDKVREVLDGAPIPQ